MHACIHSIRISDYWSENTLHFAHTEHTTPKTLHQILTDLVAVFIFNQYTQKISPTASI